MKQKSQIQYKIVGSNGIFLVSYVSYGDERVSELTLALAQIYHQIMYTCLVIMELPIRSPTTITSTTAT